MVLHDFIYEWDGKSRDGEKPVSWWPGSYHVKIIQLAEDDCDICYLYPVAVILKNAKQEGSMNTSLRNYIHNFAQKLSKEYALEIQKTLWIEVDDSIRVASLNPDQRLAPELLYTIAWRPIRPNERAMIEPYLSDM